MSNRLHNKFHRHNHHSLSSANPDYPDAGFDPIASYASPFQGEFFSQGDIVTMASLSASEGFFWNDVKIKGNLSVDGMYSYLDTQVTITSATEITNEGTQTALTVTQNGEYPIAHFFDDTNTAFFVSGSSTSPGYVGIGTDQPNKKLTVSGDISASGSIFAGGLTPSLTSNEILVYENGEFKLRSISPGSWSSAGTSLTGLSGNYVPKVSATGGALENSAIYDTGGGKIGINTTTPLSELTVQGAISASSDIETTGSFLSSGVDLLTIIHNLLTFNDNLTVNLKPGYTFGKYKHLDVIPAAGKTATEVIEMAIFDHVEPIITSFFIEKSPSSLLSYEQDYQREKGNIYSRVQAVITKSNYPLSIIEIEKYDSITTTWSTLTSINITGNPLSANVDFIHNDISLSAVDYIDYRIKVQDSYQIVNLIETYSTPLHVQMNSSCYSGVSATLGDFSQLDPFLMPYALGNSFAYSLTGLVNTSFEYTYFVFPLSRGLLQTVMWNSVDITSTMVLQSTKFMGTNVYGVTGEYIAYNTNVWSTATDTFTISFPLTIVPF